MPYLPQYLPFYLNEEGEPSAAPPTVTTLPATGITPTKATLNGSVNADGLPTDYWFEYWKGAKPLVRAAQDLGAAFIYAPETATDPLSNLGNLTLPDGELKNGAKLVTPGLIEGGAAAELDGVNDYIDTGWETRTNLLLQPSPEVANTQWGGGGGYFNNPSTVTRDTATTQFDGVASLKVVCSGTNPVEGIATAVSLTKDVEVTASIYAKGAVGGEQVRLGIGGAATGFAESAYVTLSSTEWKRISVTVKPTGTGAAAVAIIGPASKTALTFYADCALAEVSPTLGSFFPTVAQLASGEAGWSGTAHESASDIGPFARGTARTFVGLHRRDTAESNDALFGNSATGNIVRLYLTFQGEMYFNPNHKGGADVGWGVVGAAAGVTQFTALTFDGLGNTAALYIDGSLINEQALAWDFVGADSGTLRLGVSGGTSEEAFDGSLLPFMVFLGELSAEEIAELSEATTLLPNYAPAGKDGDAGEGSEAVAVSEEVTGLEYKARYTFRLYATNEEGEAFGEALTFQAGHSVIAVTREYPPDKLAVRVADPSSGQTIARWAEDEPLTENVITGIRKTGEMPGGHKEMSGSLARDPRRDYPDLPPYADIYLEQPGREIIWEGRLDKAPESDGERMVIEPAAVGHQAALEDRKGIIGPGFIDRDLGKWGEPSTQREVNVRGLEGPGGKYDYSIEKRTGSSPIDPADLAPGLIFRLGSATAGRTEIAEAFYYGGGVDIGAVRFDFKEMNGFGEDKDFFETMILSSDDVHSSTDIGTDYNQKTALDQQLTASTTGRKYATAQVQYGGAVAGEYANTRGFLNIAVLGNHGLTPQGEGSGAGFTAKQMLEYAVPLYTYLEVSDESIEDDGYIIPQAWYSDPGMLADVVKDLTKYGLLDWFVLNGKLFEVRFPGTYGRKWQASAGPSELKEAGVDASRLWRSILVRFSDVDGSTRTVGPPGSGANVEAAGLEIVDPDHPAVKAGKPREDLLDLKGICTAARAQEAGERWLEDANELSRSGSAVLSGYVMDDKSVFRPVAQIMPGDQVRFPDAASADYRKIVTTDYEHDSRSCQVSLDAPSDAIPALLERYQADLISLGL